MLLTTDAWVERLNALSREIDEISASIHPSAWEEQLAALHEKYRKLVAAPTHDPPAQLELFNEEDK